MASAYFHLVVKTSSAYTQVPSNDITFSVLSYLPHCLHIKIEGEAMMKKMIRFSLNLDPNVDVRLGQSLEIINRDEVKAKAKSLSV